MYRLAWGGIDLIFPPLNVGCGKTGNAWSPDFQLRAQRVTELICEKCGTPISRGVMCDKCLSNPPVYRKMRSWVVFESPVRDALHTMKQRCTMGMGNAAAGQKVLFAATQKWSVDFLAPAPLRKKRLKERRYNQAGWVARLLMNLVGGMRQMDYGKLAKRNHRAGEISMAHKADVRMVRRRSVLLKDVAAVTGSTIQCGMEALRSAEARKVSVITPARALSHHDMTRV